MDYRVVRSNAEREGSCYHEFVKGRWNGTHWSEGSLFVDDDPFDLLVHMFIRHFKAFDRTGPNEIPRPAGLEIVNDLRKAAAWLSMGRFEDAASIIGGLPVPIKGEPHDVVGNAAEISDMMNDLASTLEEWYLVEDAVTVLGI